MDGQLEQRARETAAEINAEVSFGADEFVASFNDSTGGTELPTTERINIIFEPFLFAATSITYHAQKSRNRNDWTSFLDKMNKTLVHYLAELHLNSEWKESNFSLHQEKIKGQFILFLQQRLRSYEEVRKGFGARLWIFLSGEAYLDKRFLASYLHHWMKQDGIAPPENIIEAFAQRVVLRVSEIRKELFTKDGSIKLPDQRELESMLADIEAEIERHKTKLRAEGKDGDAELDYLLDRKMNVIESLSKESNPSAR
jgi:hypothetical protein